MANQRGTWGQGMGMMGAAMPALVRAYMRQRQQSGPTPGTQTNMMGGFDSAMQGYGPVGAPGGITMESLPPISPPGMGQQAGGMDGLLAAGGGMPQQGGGLLASDPQGAGLLNAQMQGMMAGQGAGMPGYPQQQMQPQPYPPYGG